MSERLFRKPLLDAVCNFGDPANTLREACDVLRAWDGTANTDARGANLWDEFWVRVTRIAPERLYANGFDPAKPLATPGGFNTSNPAVVQDLRQALGGAVLALKLNGFALNSRRGDILYTTRNGARVPLYGGCDEAGLLHDRVRAPAARLDAAIRWTSTARATATCRWCRSAQQGVEADTMLAHSESDDPGVAAFRRRDAAVRVEDVVALSVHRRGDRRRPGARARDRHRRARAGAGAAPGRAAPQMRGKERASSRSAKRVYH